MVKLHSNYRLINSVKTDKTRPVSQQYRTNTSEWATRGQHVQTTMAAFSRPVRAIPLTLPILEIKSGWPARRYHEARG